MAVLSGFENEGVVFQQRDGIGGELVQVRIAQSEWGLWATWRTLLAQNVGHVVSTECAGGRGFLNGAGHVFRAVLPDQLQQFQDLTGKRAVCIRHVAEVRLQQSPRTQAIQRVEQPLLRLGTPRCRPLFGEEFFEAIGAERLTSAPRARIADDFLDANPRRTGR